MERSNFEEIKRWQQAQKQLQQEWLTWHRAKAAHYQAAEDARSASQAQTPGRTSFLNVETAFRRSD